MIKNKNVHTKTDNLLELELNFMLTETYALAINCFDFLQGKIFHEIK